MSDVDMELVKSHFRRTLSEHADPARACSWRDADVALRNFAAVSQVFAHETGAFSVYEIGCGLATYSEFLKANFPAASYQGSDILPEMIEGARQRDPGVRVDLRDVLIDPPNVKYDYVVISGLFNISATNPAGPWSEFVKQMLRSAFAIANVGVASTFLTSHVDWKREFGYYQDPSEILTFAQTELSRFSEIRHAYYPWEFTLLSYRQPKVLPFGPPPVAWDESRRGDRDDRRY